MAKDQSPAVATENVVEAGVRVAMDRISEMEAHVGATLIDDISDAQWANLDGTKTNPCIAYSGDIDCIDDPDDEELRAA